MRVAEAFVLDTSAFLTLTEEEEGVDVVKARIAAAVEGTVELHASFVSLTEVEYISVQEKGQAVADVRLADMRALPIRWHHTDDAMCSAAAKFKAAHKLSFADSFVVALAQKLDATLIHKDPEIEALGPVVKQEMLPPKTGT